MLAITLTYSHQVWRNGDTLSNAVWNACFSIATLAYSLDVLMVDLQASSKFHAHLGASRQVGWKKWVIIFMMSLASIETLWDIMRHWYLFHTSLLCQLRSPLLSVDVLSCCAGRDGHSGSPPSLWSRSWPGGLSRIQFPGRSKLSSLKNYSSRNCT